MSKGVLFPLLLVGGVVGSALEGRVRVGLRRPHQQWSVESEAKPEDAVTFSIYLKQRNLEALDAIFHNVSDPDSSAWGKFLSKDEVDTLVTADPAGYSTVMDWLDSHEDASSSASSCQYSNTSDTISATCRVSFVCSLLGVPSFEYLTHKKTGARRMVYSGEASIPKALTEHIDFIGGISELWSGQKKSVRRRARASANSPSATDIPITPAVLRNYYGIPSDEANAHPDNLQAVAAFSDFYSAGALKRFYADATTGEGQSVPNVTNIGTNCLDASDPCDELESDLDIQYMTAMGRDVPTLFHATNTDDGWMLTFTEDALKLSPLPKVYSISYGFAELYQCFIDPECEKLGYDSADYIKRVDTNFMKLGVMGVSVFVSDGDDGAANNIRTGNDPIDLKHWCPTGECASVYQSSMCGDLRITAATGESFLCVFPTAMDDSSVDCPLEAGEFLTALDRKFPECGIDAAGDQEYHLYSNCTCDKLKVSGLQVGSFSANVGPNVYQAGETLFVADYPTSSQYVTSVGATQFMSNDGTTVNAEVGCSVKTGAIITTGGGFGTLEGTRPSWQNNAVDGWISLWNQSKMPPSGTFDFTGRGYPDITLNGHNYLIYAANEADQCPCAMESVDGTSASSPASAGMFSLINGYLLAAGKSQLGFLNPLLYKLAASDPNLFNDITKGGNECTSSFCLQYGYEPAAGWDPVAGLGSPRYQKLKNAIFDLKSVA